MHVFLLKRHTEFYVSPEAEKLYEKGQELSIESTAACLRDLLINFWMGPKEIWPDGEIKYII